MGARPPNNIRNDKPASALREHSPARSGGAGNRTRVLCRFNRASPCAVHIASTRPRRSREQAGVTGPAAVSVPLRPRGRVVAVSLLADAGRPGRRRPRADRHHPSCLGSESDVALGINLGAYWFAATLEVAIRLHLHASPESTSRVETVHPLVVALFSSSITRPGSGIIPFPITRVGKTPPQLCGKPHGPRRPRRGILVLHTDEGDQRWHDHRARRHATEPAVAGLARVPGDEPAGRDRGVRVRGDVRVGRA